MHAQWHGLDAKARTVRHLHLRVPHENDSVRARIALEDGLATADFGDAGRLILVRHLTLPRFVGDLSGPKAARVIEASYRALLPTAVHGADPRAPMTNVVWFEDRLEALLEALSVRVDERPLNAWFWRQALGPLFPVSSAEAVPSLFQAIATWEGPGRGRPVGLLALARRWRTWSEPSFTRFLRSLPAAMLQAAELPTPTVAEVDGTHTYKGVPASALRVIEQARARILAAVKVGLDEAAWVTRWELAAGDVALPSGAVSLVSEVVADIVRGEFQSGVPVAERAGQESILEERTPEWAPKPRSFSSSFPTASATSASVQTSPALPGVESASWPVGAEEVRLLLPPWLSDASPSAHGGFFMLLNAWQALGFHDWLDAQAPELQAAIARVWLERWATRLRMPAEDPQRFVWQTLHEMELSASSVAALDDWALRTRRWLRTRALIGPASLVLRSGAVCVTRTHIDVVFPLQKVDLRVRRAGLDRDPGWVAWLGRIVAFHFVDE
jgi:hypothetical protein